MKGIVSEHTLRAVRMAKQHVGSSEFQVSGLLSGIRDEEVSKKAEFALSRLADAGKALTEILSSMEGHQATLRRD